MDEKMALTLTTSGKLEYLTRGGETNMAEAKKRRVGHIYYSKSIHGEIAKGTIGPQPSVSISMSIDEADMTDEQLEKLFDFVDRAAADIDQALGW